MLFQFKVWVDGMLCDCSLKQSRDGLGRFIRNINGEYLGTLDNGVSGVIRQDDQAKLYFIPQLEELERRR